MLSKRLLRLIVERSEIVMFSLGLIFLICLSVLVVIWIDVPGLQERAETAIGQEGIPDAELLIATSSGIGRLVLPIMWVIWLVVLGEAIVHWVSRPWTTEMKRYHIFGVFICLCPALRMCARSPEMNGRIYLPWMGWRKGGRRLQRHLERKLSIPMMVIALLILPILLIDLALKDQVAQHTWLRLLLHIGTGVIWFAFAAEFILMVSIAEKKIEYCKQHWIDLAIILLPLISFLRTLSIMRMARLSNLMKVQQLTKFARAYRLRGTMIKAFRVLILFELTERILGVSDERKIQKLEVELEETEKQARLLRQKIARLRLKSQEDADPETMTR